MKCFLTSSTVIPNTGQLNPTNGFLDRLKACVPDGCKCLFICSDPDSWERTDGFAQSVCESFLAAGIAFEQFHVLDRRNLDQASQLVQDAQLMILAGGHVPTQNKFFAEIGLKELLCSFDGVLVGISAGSMNCARVVYAQPELEGEAVDPTYQRFIPGLGLTEKMVLPHYQMIKDEVLDGLRVMEDIAYPDSMGREFYVLVDGSYLYIDNGVETIYGEAYRLADGTLSQGRLCGGVRKGKERTDQDRFVRSFASGRSGLLPDHMETIWPPLL